MNKDKLTTPKDFHGARTDVIVVEQRNRVLGRRRWVDTGRGGVGEGESAEGTRKGMLWKMRRFDGLQTRCDDRTILAVKVM